MPSYQEAHDADLKVPDLTHFSTDLQVGYLHTFWYSFATHPLEDGYDIRRVQDLLGIKDVKSTLVYTHVLNRGPSDVCSPEDGLLINQGLYTDTFIIQL